MDGLGNILQGAGILVCIGGILLAVLAFFLVRSVFGSRTKDRLDRRDPQVFEKSGSERPRYDDDRIESSGGFGRAPTSSRRIDDDTPLGNRLPRRQLDDDRPDRPPREADDDRPLHTGGQNLGRSERRESDRDDDDIRSRGGFGG